MISTPLSSLLRFHGGIKPPTNKAVSTTAPICTTVPMPQVLTVLLGQSAGNLSIPLVEPGQRVLKGQRIGAADGIFSVAVHAPTSGTVRAITPALAPHSSGLSVPAVIIEPDGEDAWIECETPHLEWGEPDVLRDIVRDAGIVGLGGAVFPSHIKLKALNQKKYSTLIINGAECEPFITCDDMLMRERAAGILRGATLAARLLQAEQIIIAIENNKPEAIAAMEKAIHESGDKNRHTVAGIPTLYPAGSAKQLIYILTGLKVPHGRLPTEYGVQCFNIGTAYAIHQAFDQCRPLISRIVTVTGNVERPGNYEVLIGTPMDEIVALSGPRPDTDRYIMGGPMMGQRMPAYNVPVVKATNAILVGSPSLFPEPPPAQSCIRCGQCAEVCPSELQPFELYWYSRARNFGKAQEYHLFDCIECGCCAYVCPAHIPLVDYYRFAKSEIWAREQENQTANAARERFEFRNFRQQREQEEKAARLAAKTAEGLSRAAVAATDQKESGTEDPKKALIAAALERAKTQQARVTPRNTAGLDAKVQAEIAQIEARRQQYTPTTPVADNTADTSPPPENPS